MANSSGKKVYAFLILVLAVVAFLLGYYTFAYRYGNSGREGQTAVPVTETLALAAEPVNGRPVPFEKSYIGYVTPIHEAHIQPYISGFIEKVFVHGGEFVRRGDLLVVLQQDQYRAEMAAAYADILKAEANFKNAEIYYNRIQKAGAKAVSPTELDNARAQFLSAKAALEQAKAKYELARVNFGYTVIRSPIDGIIGDVPLTPGNYVSPSSGALLSVIQYNPIRVVFSVTDKEYLKDINKPHPFANETIYLKLSNGKIFPNPGTFQYTDNAIEKSTNSVTVYADFANLGKTLVPNAYVTVMVRKVFENAVAVSKSNVYMEESGNYVYILRNGALIKEKVEILASEDARFILKNSFQNGDFILTEPFKDSYAGKTVQPKTTQNGNNTAALQPADGTTAGQKGEH